VKTPLPTLVLHGAPKYHQANPESMSKEAKQKERDFRKKLNQDAREIISDSIHKKVKLIVHRPECFQDGANVDLCIYRV
jgi:hypothetical protein